MFGFTQWNFLGEPAYRWALFTVMMIMFLVAMGAVLRHM